jgi:hypothetical protein
VCSGGGVKQEVVSVRVYNIGTGSHIGGLLVGHEVAVAGVEEV